MRRTGWIFLMLLLWALVSAGGASAEETFKDMLIYSLGAYDLGDYPTALGKLEEARELLEGRVYVDEANSFRLPGRAKRYGIIDAHEHIWEGMDVDSYIRIMDEFGISRVVLLATGSGPRSEGHAERLAELLEAAARYPDRIVPFASVDHNGPDPLGELREAVERGAKGLKLMVGHPEAYQEPVDSPKMFELYAFAGEHHLPVIVHAEMRWKKELREGLENAVRNFPATTFILAHMGNLYYYDGGLEELSALLDRYPNLYVDSSMGKAFNYYIQKIHWDPMAYRRFFEQYQDRIVWGSDQVVGRGTKPEFLRDVFRVELSLLEKDRYTGFYDYFPEEPISGLNLPDPVLKKVLHDNPSRIFNLQ